MIAHWVWEFARNLLSFLCSNALVLVARRSLYAAFVLLMAVALLLLVYTLMNCSCSAMGDDSIYQKWYTRCEGNACLHYTVIIRAAAPPTWWGTRRRKKKKNSASCLTGDVTHKTLSNYRNWFAVERGWSDGKSSTVDNADVCCQQIKWGWRRATQNRGCGCRCVSVSIV